MKLMVRGLAGSVIAIGAVGLIAFFALPGETFATLPSRLAALPWYAVLLLLLIQSASLALLVTQWTALLGSSVPESRVSWRAVLPRYLAGSFVEAVTPSAKLGGEATRLALFARRFGINASTIGTLAAVRAACMPAGLVVLLPLGVWLGAAAFVPQLGGLPPADSAIRWGALLVVPPATIALLGYAARRIRVAAPSLRTATGVAALAVVIWALYPVKVALAAEFLGVTVSFGVVVAATFGAYFVGLLPITPGGLGGYEAAMVAVFVSAGVSPADATAITVLARAVSYWWPLALSVPAAVGLLGRTAGGLPVGNRFGNRTGGSRKPTRRGREGWGEGALVGAVKLCERLAARTPQFARLYAQAFYRTMVEREYLLAELQPGDRVAQIGCGPFPMTALQLASRGCHVTAIDCDEAALKAAAGAISALRGDNGAVDGAGGSVTFAQARAEELEYEGYEAVIVALHVSPKLPVLRRVLETADAGTRLLYRNPRSVLRGAYQRVTPGAMGLSQSGRIAKLPGNKELVMVKKPVRLSKDGEVATARCAECALCDLAPRELGTIAHAPDLPALAALGVRPGKTCSLVAAHPWGGPVICSVGGRQVALERSIAADIGILPLGCVAECSGTNGDSTQG